MIALAAPPSTPYADRDWTKIRLLLAGRWPRPLPEQTITTKALDVAEWIRRCEDTPRVAIDVEGGGYDQEGRPTAPTVIGLAAPLAVPTLLIDWAGADLGHRMAIANWLTTLFMLVPVVGHWVARDVALLENEGVRFDRIDDSGIAHAVVHPGEPHSLVHACSVYGQYGWTKGTPRRTQGDVLGALDVWYGCERAMPSRVVRGVEVNGPRWRYEWHRTVTLPQAIERWRHGWETNYVASVDPTWTKEAA